MDVLTKPRVTKPTKSLLRLVHARGHTVNIGSLMFVFYWERFTWHAKSPLDNSHEIRRMHQKLQVDTNPIYQRLIRKLRQPSQTAGEVHSNPTELEHTEPRDNRRRNCAFKFFCSLWLIIDCLIEMTSSVGHVAVGRNEPKISKCLKVLIQPKYKLKQLIDR